jgi:uncharacterized membrane protein YccC
MSSGEKFFNAKSLVRIAHAVEWPDLELYKDGTSTQGRFMEAIALLYRQWFIGSSLPDAVDVAKDFLAKDWASAFRHTLEELPSKLTQVMGFYRGLGGKYAGRTAAAGGILRASTTLPPADSSSIESEVYWACDSLIKQLREILAEEETNG